MIVIDDEQQILRALRTILGQQNYQVITAGLADLNRGSAAALTDPNDVGNFLTTDPMDTHFCGTVGLR